MRNIDRAIFYKVFHIPILILFFLASTPAGAAVGGGLWVAGNFETYVFDHEQRDSQLIVSPSGKTLLIDAGEASWNTGNGAAFIANTQEHFDVIIVDSTDPIGPGEVLFEQDFYRHCHAHLTPGGVLVTQNGVAFMQLDEARNTATRFGRVFKDWHFYASAVPTYIGGAMLMSFGTDDATLRRQSVATISARFQAADLNTRYYTPEVHVGAFALPRYVLQAIGKEIGE